MGLPVTAIAFVTVWLHTRSSPRLLRLGERGRCACPGVCLAPRPVPDRRDGLSSRHLAVVVTLAVAAVHLCVWTASELRTKTPAGVIELIMGLAPRLTPSEWLVQVCEVVAAGGDAWGAA